MSKSFSIDLNQFTLYRAIPGQKQILKTRVDRVDAVSVLNDLGYQNIKELGITRARYGIIPSIEDTLSFSTIGIPTNAYVEVKSMGRKSNLLLFTFTY